MSEGLNKKVTILTTTHFKASAHRLHKTYPANHDRRFTHTNLIENTINGAIDRCIGFNYKSDEIRDINTS